MTTSCCLVVHVVVVSREGERRCESERATINKSSSVDSRSIKYESWLHQIDRYYWEIETIANTMNHSYRVCLSTLAIVQIEESSKDLEHQLVREPWRA